eukprot:CFRG3975T1
MVAKVLLFHFPPGVHSMMVRLVLEEKEIEWEESVINELVNEDISPWYIEELNETADVPTLVHGKKVISDVEYICTYLEKNFPHQSLTPEDPTSAADMHKWVKKCLNMSKSTLYRNRSGVRRIMTIDQLKERSEVAEANKQQYPNLAVTYNNVINQTNELIIALEDEKVLEENMKELETSMNELDDFLKSKQFLCGSRFSFADAACVAVLRDLELSRLNILWGNGKRRNIARYYRRHKQGPSFGCAIEDYPLTLDLILPSLVSTGMRMLQKKPVQVVLAGVAGAVALRWLFKSPNTNAPIMIYF